MPLSSTKMSPINLKRSSNHIGENNCNPFLYHTTITILSEICTVSRKGVYSSNIVQFTRFVQKVTVVSKKIITIIIVVIGCVVLSIGGFMGWFSYQMRDLQTINSARIADSLYVVEGNMSNMYLLRKGDLYVGFDAADKPEKIRSECEELSIDPSSVKAIFLTHSDGDHVNGLPAFPVAKVYLPEEEVPLLQTKQHRHFLGMKMKNKLPVDNFETVSDGDSIIIGEAVIHVIATPGHTRGSTCYRVGASLFTGDLCTVMDGKVFPMLKIFTEDMSADSLSIVKIAAMDNIDLVFTAHSGYITDFQDAFKKWR